MNGTIEMDSQNGIIPWRCIGMGSYHGDRITSWKGTCTIDADENISPIENPIFMILTKSTSLQTLCINCNDTESL